MEPNDKKLLWAVLLAVLGGNTGAVLNAYSPTVRADSFSSSKASALEARMVETHHILANRILKNEFELERCVTK